MSNTYTPDRNNEVKAVADPLIAQYHSHLIDANIVYIFRDNEKQSKGIKIHGEAKKSGEYENFFTGAHFIISVYRYGWDNFYNVDQQKKVALVDHLLSHCKQAIDKDGFPKVDNYGDPVWQFVKPDANVFFDVIQRHGAWNEETEAIFRIAKQGKTVTIDDKQPVEA